jgi:transaldolase
MNRPKTLVLLDGADPTETRSVKERIGFLDGQTTNPTLVSRNPHIQELLQSGHKLSEPEERDEYRKIVTEMSRIIGHAGVSIEVFADRRTSAEDMLDQAKDMYYWIPNAYIKYPCTTEGLKAAEVSVERGLRVNMTLCFSQAQVAAVYAATKRAKTAVYVSPFVGRLDDIGQNGMDLIKNAKRMLAKSDGHVSVLASSIRNVEQLLYCFFLEAELVTAPAKVLLAWAERGLPLPPDNFQYQSAGRPIEYQELDLNRAWQTYDISNELTWKGIDKFAGDYREVTEAT